MSFDRRKELITERTLFSNQPKGLDLVACPYCETVGKLYLGVTRKYVGCQACVMYFGDEDFVKRIGGE